MSDCIPHVDMVMRPSYYIISALRISNCWFVIVRFSGHLVKAMTLLRQVGT